MILVSKAKSKARLRICEACPHLKKNIPHLKTEGKIEPNLCNLCGCYMPVKTMLKGVSCPSKKW